MAEFYKYAKRGADSQVDWATIGSNFTKVLQDEVKFREEKKAAIEKDTNDLGNRLANTPLGESTTFNQWALNGTDQIMKARLLQDRLLRSGQLKYKDYVALRQNLTNSTNTLFGLAKTFNERYKKIMDRSNSKDPATRSQYAELFLAGRVEGFAKFTNSAVALNPYDNTLSVTMLGAPNKDGIRSSTGEILRADEMLNFLTTEYNYYDPNARLKPYVESMGEVEQIIIEKGDAFRTGFIKTINDPTQRNKLSSDTKDILDKYEQWEKNTISAEMEPTNKTSMLTNSIKIDPISKKPYDFTFSKEEFKKNSNLILMKQNSIGTIDFEFSENQNKQAEDFVKNQLRNMFDQKISAKAYNEPSETREEKRAKINMMEAQSRKADEPKTPTKKRGLTKEEKDLWAKDVSNLITEGIAQGTEENAYDNLNQTLSGFGYEINQAEWFNDVLEIKKLNENEEEVTVRIPLKKPDTRAKIIYFLNNNPPPEYNYKFTESEIPVKQNTPGQQFKANTSEKPKPIKPLK